MLQKLMFETEGNMGYHLQYFLENGEQRYSETGLSVPWIRVPVEKLSGGTMSRRRGEERATLVTVDQPFRHRTNQNQHPEFGCWISLVDI